MGRSRRERFDLAASFARTAGSPAGRGLGQVAECVRPFLTPEQVMERGLPADPVKEQDPRLEGFKELFPALGDTSYEMEALPIPERRRILNATIAQYFDTEIAAAFDAQREIWNEEYASEMTQIEDNLRTGLDQLLAQ